MNVYLRDPVALLGTVDVQPCPGAPSVTFGNGLRIDIGQYEGRDVLVVNLLEEAKAIPQFEIDPRAIWRM